MFAMRRRFAFLAIAGLGLLLAGGPLVGAACGAGDACPMAPGAASAHHSAPPAPAAQPACHGVAYDGGAEAPPPEAPGLPSDCCAAHPAAPVKDAEALAAAPNAPWQPLLATLYSPAPIALPAVAIAAPAFDLPPPDAGRPLYTLLATFRL